MHKAILTLVRGLHSNYR